MEECPSAARARSDWRIAPCPGSCCPVLLRIVRGITRKGGRFRDVAGELACLEGILMALFVLASSRFSKKLA